MLKPKYSKQFKKDQKRYQHQRSFMATLQEVIKSLLQQHPLQEKFCDHPLGGNWMGHRECHVKPDMLLIYKSNQEYLFLERVGSHSELFK